MPDSVANTRDVICPQFASFITQWTAMMIRIVFGSHVLYVELASHLATVKKKATEKLLKHLFH